MTANPDDFIPWLCITRKDADRPDYGPSSRWAALNIHTKLVSFYDTEPFFSEDHFKVMNMNQYLDWINNGRPM